MLCVFLCLPIYMKDNVRNLVKIAPFTELK